MKDNNNDKNLNVPHLRFPEFSGEWEKSELHKVASLSKGTGISKEQLSEEGLPCILYGELYTKYRCEVINEIISKTNLEPEKLVKSQTNDVVIPCSGETSIDIATARCVKQSDVLLGGDLNIIRLKGEYDGAFFAYQLNGKRKYDIARVAQGVSVVHLYGEHLKRVKVNYPSITEQKKISSLLTLVDQRIETQKKIIEDLKKLKDAISKLLFRHRAGNEYTIGELCKSIAVKQYISIDVAIDGTYPIIQQGESPVAGYTESAPFFDYEKVILFGDHTLSIYRPNVPFLLSTDGIKILRPNDLVLRDYLYYLLYAFMPKSEGYKRHYSILKDICVPVPDIDTQKSIVEELLSVDSKIEIEVRVLKLQIQQKEYCLNHMFI